MSRTSHTPGPWHVIKPGFSTAYVIQSRAGVRVGILDECDNPADPQTLAAAAQLVDLLQEAVSIGVGPPWYDRARTLLAQLKGAVT